MPADIDRAYKIRNIDELKQLKVMLCMNCGSCSDCAGCDQMGAATHALGQGLLTMLQGLLLVIISGVATSGSTVSFIVNRD